eukprot:UN25592
MLRLQTVLKHLTPKKSYSLRAMTSSVSNSGINIDSHGNNYLITLNRPKALNALNLDMINVLTPFFKKVSESKEKTVVVMKGEGGKAFCAGGDVRSLYDMRQEGKSVKDIVHFFKEEYALNQILGTLPENVQHVCLMNGITMGGGVGLSCHGRYRVATDNTMFAMPETALGFFCDVGGGYFLPRLPSPGMGMWLALTGSRLKGEEVYHAGVATHYANAEKLATLEKDLLALDDSSKVPQLLSNYKSNSVTQLPLKSIKQHFTLDGMESIT